MSSGIPAALKDFGRERKLVAGEHLFKMGNTPVGIYEVVSGRVRLSRTGTAGEDITLYVAGPGDILAEASLFSKLYHCDAVALSDATVRLYPKAKLIDEFRANPDAAAAFMAVLAHEVMRLRTCLERRNIRSARERIRHYLETGAGADRRVILSGTLKEIATELGLTHETFYRTLREMADAGEIVRQDGEIRLLQR